MDIQIAGRITKPFKNQVIPFSSISCRNLVDFVKWISDLWIIHASMKCTTVMAHVWRRTRSEGAGFKQKWTLFIFYNTWHSSIVLDIWSLPLFIPSFIHFLTPNTLEVGFVIHSTSISQFFVLYHNNYSTFHQESCYMRM